MVKSNTVTVNVTPADVTVDVDVVDEITGNPIQNLEIEIPEANIKEDLPRDATYSNSFDGTLGTYTIIVKDKSVGFYDRYEQFEKEYQRQPGGSITESVEVPPAENTGTIQ